MIDALQVLEELRGAIRSMNTRLLDSQFTVQHLPQSGRGCLARFLLDHNYANGINLSRTEVAITHQISARHRYVTWESGSGKAGDQKAAGDGVDWGDLLMTIFHADQR